MNDQDLTLCTDQFDDNGSEICRSMIPLVKSKAAPFSVSRKMSKNGDEVSQSSSGSSIESEDDNIGSEMVFDTPAKTLNNNCTAVLIPGVQDMILRENYKGIYDVHIMNLYAPAPERTTRVLDMDHVCNLKDSYQEAEGQLVIFVGMLKETTDNLTMLYKEGHGLESEEKMGECLDVLINEDVEMYKKSSEATNEFEECFDMESNKGSEVSYKDEYLKLKNENDLLIAKIKKLKEENQMLKEKMDSNQSDDLKENKKKRKREDDNIKKGDKIKAFWKDDDGEVWLDATVIFVYINGKMKIQYMCDKTFSTIPLSWVKLE
ncbi:hypothetical protein ACF0H5_015857 [Mactra antiquata]